MRDPADPVDRAFVVHPGGHPAGVPRLVGLEVEEILPGDAQRHELLAGLAAAQRAELAEPDGSVAGLLLEGVVLRLQADLRWLEACARYWNETKGR